MPKSEATVFREAVRKNSEHDLQQSASRFV